MSELVLEKNNENNPSGWEFVPLSQIAEINPKMQNGTIDSDLQVSFVPMKCVEELSGQIDLCNSRKYEEVKRGYTYFANGDILFAKITPCMENGKIVIAKNLQNGIGFGSTEFHVVRLLDKDMPREFYFWYLMQDKFRNNARHNMKGTAGQLRVPVSFIENSIVPVPPLNEQKRIVSKIEELFSKIEYGIENLQKTRLQLNEYKQSILKNAFNGSLTMNWRKKHGSQLEKVTEILKKAIENKQGFDDNYLHQFPQDVETLPKLPPQWVWTTIGLVSESMKNGIYKPKSSYSNKGIACLRMYNIEDGELVWKNIKRMNLSQKEISEYELLPNDLLVNRVNSRELVGKTARIPEGVERCVYESKNIRLRLFRNFTNSNLVAYWFKLFRQTFFNRNAQQTVGMASINQEQLSQMPIPYMHISEQNELVKQIEFHFTIVKNSLSLIENNLKYLDKLRNSVLKQTFEGKLVPQDPHDEPAKILLQKMKQEKETLQEKQKDSKTKSRRIKNAK